MPRKGGFFGTHPNRLALPYRSPPLKSKRIPMYRITVSELFPLEDKYNPNCTESSMLLKTIEGKNLQELIRELLYEETIKQ